MNDGTAPHSDQEITNNWAIAEIGPGISRILAAKGLMHPDTERCIGFFYVDHEEGIIFRIHSLCRIEPGKPRTTAKG